MVRKRGSYRRRQMVKQVKKERYEQKELERLKRTLGLIDEEGNVLMKDISEIATIKTADDVKTKKKSESISPETQEIQYEIEEERSPAEIITVVNEKSGKVHKYNTKTLRDEYGSYPPWFNRRNTAKRLRKKAYSQKRRFKGNYWKTHNVML